MFWGWPAWQQRVRNGSAHISTMRAGCGKLDLRGGSVSFLLPMGMLHSSGHVSAIGGSVSFKTKMAAGAGILSLNGKSVTFKSSAKFAVGAGVLSLVGEPITFKSDAKFAVGAGVLNLNGKPITFKSGTKFLVGAGVLNLNGKPITFKSGTKFLVDAGVLNLNGKPITFKTGVKFAVGAGVMSLNGEPVTFATGSATTYSDIIFSTTAGSPYVRAMAADTGNITSTNAATVFGSPPSLSSARSTAKSASGKYVAITYKDVSNNCIVRVVDLTTKTLVANLTAASFGTYTWSQDVAFTSDDAYLIVAAGDSSPPLKVYRTSDWTEVTGLSNLPSYYGFGVATAPGLIAFASYTGGLFLYDNSLSLITGPAAENRPSSGCMSVAFSPNGSRLYATCFAAPKGIWAWNTADWSVVSAFDRNTFGAYALDSAVNADGSRLAVVFNGGSKALFNTSTGAQITLSGSSITNCADVMFSSDGSKVYFSNVDNANQIEVFNASTGALLTTETLAAQVVGHHPKIVNLSNWT